MFLFVHCQSVFSCIFVHCWLLSKFSCIINKDWSPKDLQTKDPLFCSWLTTWLFGITVNIMKSKLVAVCIEFMSCCYLKLSIQRQIHNVFWYNNILKHKNTLDKFSNWLSFGCNVTFRNWDCMSLKPYETEMKEWYILCSGLTQFQTLP